MNTRYSYRDYLPQDAHPNHSAGGTDQEGLAGGILKSTHRITTDTLAERFRTSGEAFRVSGTVYPKAGGAFVGQGTIERSDDEFLLRLTFPPGKEAPATAGGFYRYEDFWRFEGNIDDDLAVVIEHLPPGGPRHWSNGITSQEYSAHTISFPQSSVRHDDVDGAQSVGADASSEEADSSSSWIHAVLLDFPLIQTNAGTTFTEKNDFLGESITSSADTYSGSFDGVKYGLINREGDLHVHLFRPGKTNNKSGDTTDEQFLTAFLKGLAFATGQHAWPYRVTVRRDGVILADKVNAVRKVDRTALAPFGERIGFNATIGSIKWDFGEFLGKATHFFNVGSALAESASKALWLLRAADAKRIPGEITLSSLCVLLESLSGRIFDELRLEAKAEAEVFEEAKAEVRAWLEKHPRIKESGFLRLRNLVASASLLRPQDKYRAVCDHFGLTWEGLMKDAWDTWQAVRHKNVHAVLADDRSDIQGHFTAIGRIGGAINILILRLIGYSGITRASVFEDKHHNI